MKRALIAIALPLAACATTSERAATCDASGISSFQGALATADLATLAMKRAHARTLRWLRPGMAVTMEYRLDRLTIEVDERNFIKALRCG